jgi:hypothetical protein
VKDERGIPLYAFHLEPDEIERLKPDLSRDPNDPSNDQLDTHVIEITDYGTCVLLRDATKSDWKAYEALIEVRARRAEKEAEVFAKWAAEQAALGRDTAELTFGNCIRELGLLVDKPAIFVKDKGTIQ